MRLNDARRTLRKKVFWGWLTDDEFTHQRATYLGHNSAEDCDVWQHNSGKFYPGTFNQTACVRLAGSAPPAPVVMHWYGGGGNNEVKTFSGWVPYPKFPSGQFTPPKRCKPIPDQSAAAAAIRQRVARVRAGPSQA